MKFPCEILSQSDTTPRSIMDDFGFSGAVKRREAELARRRETMRKSQEAQRSQYLEAQNRTDELLQEAEGKRKEKQLITELAIKRDEGAPDNGLKLERILTTAENSALPPDSDRVLLPVDVLESLSSDSRAVFPWMFELFSPDTGRRTHCGVLEFSADAGCVALPKKVFGCLAVDPGASVRLRYKALPKCSGVTLRVPFSLFSLFPDFKAFLEASLHKQYTTLTLGDSVLVRGQVPLLVEKLEPDLAVCLIDTDVTLNLIVQENESDGSTEKWTVSSSTAFKAQESEKRLWLRGTKSFEIQTSQSVDIYVTFPPGTEASAFVFDEASFVDSDSVNGNRLVISSDHLLKHQSPEFITVGIASHSDSIQVEAREISEVSEPSVPLSLCPYCKSQVAASSLEIHSLRCQSMFAKCDECDMMIRKSDFQDHAHCVTCKRVFRKSAEQKHNDEWHSQVQCLCGQTVTRATLQQHRMTSCPNRLIACRFCGCSFPQGDLSRMDARDRFMGFVSEHEASCGNRTDTCTICGRRERLKDMAFHIQAYHPE